VAAAAAAAAAAAGADATTATAGRELQIDVGGLQLAGVSYGDERSPLKVLALHGWMDNAATHMYTAPVWAAAGFHVVALDLPGHGHSDKRHAADRYDAGNYPVVVMEAANRLGWSSFALCSHSMGAGISSMVAGAWPGRVTALVVLEGIGMNTKEEGVAATALAASVSGRGKLAAKGGAPKLYASRHAAALARVATTRRYPGTQFISYGAAAALVERGTVAVGDGGAPDAPPKVRFIHDTRLMEPSPTYLSEAQMTTFLRSVRCPTLCVTGTQGWPWMAGLMMHRIASVADMEHHHIRGGHHLHLDPDTAPTVAAILRDFLARRREDMEATAAASAAAAAAAAGGGGASSRHRTAPPSAGTAVAPAARYHPVLSSSSSPVPSIDEAAAAAAAASTGDADAAAIHGAAEIANTGAAAGDGDGTSAAAAAAGAGAPDGSRGRSALDKRREGVRAWTPLHVHISVTERADAALTDYSGAGGGEAGTRIQLHDNVITTLRSETTVNAATPDYWWQGKTAAAGSGDDSMSRVWYPLPDATSSVPTRLLHARGLRDLSVGAWVPRVFLDTMPTLEAATAAAAAASPAGAAGAAKRSAAHTITSGSAADHVGGTDAAGGAVAAGRAALESKGDAY